MILDGTARFWDVRFDVPTKRRVKQPDGSFTEYDWQEHKLACVAASTIAEAIILVQSHWPKATIWQAVNHGRECNVLVAPSLVPPQEQ